MKGARRGLVLTLVLTLVAAIGGGSNALGLFHPFLDDESVKIYGVEPTESPLLSEGQAAPHKIQGLGPNVVPEILDQEIWDELLHIESDVAITYEHSADRAQEVVRAIESLGRRGAAIQADSADAAAVRRSVPLNAMCSRKCDTPFSASLSWRVPVAT